jgi:hypothetical protein
MKGAILLVAVMASVIAIVMLVPDDGDYDRSTLLKHQRLAQFDSRKIVLIGGSNLAYGIDSTMIERATGCPVVNMGMNGFLGVRYMLEEVKTQLQPSDLVVLAFEWDNYYKSVDGAASTLFALVRTNPVAFTYLSFNQKIQVLLAIPDVAQQKVMRLLNEGITALKNVATGSSDSSKSPRVQLSSRIETRAGFSSKGDLISHLGVKWPFSRSNGVIPPNEAIEMPMIAMMRNFAAEMKERDVAVMVSYTSTIRHFYDLHRRTFDEAHRLVKTMPPLAAPSPPARFVFDENNFFDTAYHLNAEGRKLRTQRLIDDLKLQWHGRASCTKSATVNATAQTGD